jgi:anaerobic ribonucleoside-triphosphate reductase
MQKLQERLKEIEQKLKNFKVQECEIYSRVTGYYRPVSQFNPGKQEEFSERKTYEDSIEEVKNA